MINKIIGMFRALQVADVQAARPADRRTFADLCRHWGAIADPPKTPPTPRSGVLGDLKQRGGRSD